MAKRRGILLFLVTLLLASASIWFNQSWLDNKQDNDDESKKDQLSHYFTRFSLMSTDAKGVIEHRLTGKHFSYWSDKELSEILDPQLISYSTQKEPTKMIADKAIMLHEQDVMELQDSVIIKGFASGNKEDTTLTTERLRYHPDDKRIETDQEVTFTSDTSWMIGIGLDSNLDDKKLRIKSNVHSRFEKK